MRLQVLVDAALDLAAAHTYDGVLERLVERAAGIAGARYAALGVYDPDAAISRFVHFGVDDTTVRTIGSQPVGRGLLGEVVTAGGPIRVPVIDNDPRAIGFPSGHPHMRSFLGVPIRSGARRHGNLYVADKIGADTFDETDEQLLVTLAAFAACAIDNALLVQAESGRMAALDQLATAEEAGRIRQAVLEQVIAAQEAERARIARDLHDQIGQALTSMLLALRVYQNAGPATVEGRQRGDELRQLITDALDDVRQLASELRPAVLDDIGLVAALIHLGETVAHRLTLEIRWTITGIDDEHRLPSEQEVAVYRIAQEALTNVARHADVDRVEASLTADQSAVTLEITDQGAGFEPERVRGSLGIAGMYERAALIGGELTIQSEPGNGSRVQLRVPR